MADALLELEQPLKVQETTEIVSTKGLPSAPETLSPIDIEHQNISNWVGSNENVQDSIAEIRELYGKQGEHLTLEQLEEINNQVAEDYADVPAVQEAVERLREDIKAYRELESEYNLAENVIVTPFNNNTDQRP